MPLNAVYRLAEGVQVRSETFGLLFYDYRGPRLYFVPSKHLVPEDFFQGRQTVADVTDGLCTDRPEIRDRLNVQLTRVLEALEKKGLVHGQPIC